MSQDQFFDGIDPGSGKKMKALFDANSHLFVKKQQRFITEKLDATIGRFGGISVGDTAAADTHGTAETSDHDKKRRRRSSSSGNKEDRSRSRSRRKSGRKSRSRRRSKDRDSS